MKRCIIIIMGILLLLTGCQLATEPERKEFISPVEEEIIYSLPPKSISLYNLEELNQIKAIVKTENKSDIQETACQYGLESGDDIEDFLEIINTMPILKLFDGEIVHIGYQWPITENDNEGENLTTSRKDLGIASITIKAKDGSWFRVNYWLNNRNMSREEILESSDRSISLLKTPIQALNDRCYVYHETRVPHSTDNGEVIIWLAVVDGIPVRIRYYTETANTIKAETVFQNAAIGDIA